jgi:3-oxoacyl-[acyl-carrier protein] reductase
MDLGLRGRTVIVSGGSKGIGRAIAEEFAREGARVAIAARGRPAIDDTVESIRREGGVALGVAADMTDPTQIQQAIATVTERLDAPDIAVSNVDAPDARRGSQFRCGFEDAKDADFDQTHAQLVMSVVHLTREVLPAMKERKWGRLLNISSHAAKEPHAPPTQMILSNFGRLGAVGLMKTLSYEYGIYNITANVIATGSFDTDLAASFFAKHGMTRDTFEEALRKTGIGACRLGRPEELAAAVVFLCSERASFISGETITVTGGQYQGTF